MTNKDTHDLCQFFDSSPYGLKEKVLLEICRRDPNFLLDVIREVTKEPWMAECLALLGSGKKVDAIKLWRHHKKVPLKDAKDAVEAL